MLFRSGNTVYGYVEAIYPEEEADWDTWEYPEMDEEDYVSQEMIDALVEAYPDEVKGVAADVYVGSGQIKESADRYANVTIDGVTTEYLDYSKIELVAGRSITARDNKEQKGVCLIADTMANFYFGDENPIGQIVSFVSADGSGCDLTVVGVYE